MNENEVMELMNNINYGWIDKNGNKHIDDFENYADDYRLQEPKDLINSKLGVCWDQVELERYYFKNNIKTYFIVHYDGDKCPTHTFLVFEKNREYYWFEHAWEKFRGIHKYNSLNELLGDVRNKFIHCELKDKYDDNNLVMYEYDKPKYNISVQEYYKHCEKGKTIII